MSGDLKIEDIKDEKLQEKIKNYQTWVDKAKECKDNVEKLKQTEKELYQQRFDNISAAYEGTITLKDNKKSLIESYSSLAESQGYDASVKYAEAIKDIEKSRKTSLVNQRNKMQEELDSQVKSGKLTRGSEAWKNMVADIQAVDIEIVNTQKNIQDLDNEIRQIGWDTFDKAREKISNVISDSDYLIKLMSDEDMFDEDTGKITDEGMATMGLHTANYELYLSEVKKYQDELAKINKDIAKNPHDQKLIDRKQELIEKQQESALAAKSERDALIDLAENGIAAQLSVMKELIDSYTDALDSQKDLYNYQRKVKSQTEDIAKLQKQLSAYERDSSEEGQAKAQKIRKELEDAEIALKETEEERALSNQKELLSQMYEQYEEILNDKLKDTDQLIKEITTAVNNNSGSIMTTISNAASSIGTTVSNAIKNIVTNKGGVEKGVEKVQNDVNTAVNNPSKDTNANNNINTANTTYNNTTAAQNPTSTTGAGKKTETPTEPAPKAEPKKLTGKALADSILEKLAKKDRLTKANKKKLNKDTSIVDRLKYYDFKSSKSIRGTYFEKMGLGKKSKYKGTAAQNKKMLNWMKNHGYKHGVYDLKQDEYAFTQEVAPEAIVRKDGSVLMPLTAGTSVLNGDATKNFYDFMNNPLQYMNDLMGKEIKSTSPNTSNNNTTIESNIQFTMTLPGITNYEEFKSKMVKDKDFEKRIQAMSVDLLAGKSALSKYKK
jgi:hypothetical protein